VEALFFNMPKYEYIVSDDGIIYRKSGKGLKEVPKRLSVRGYLEFKMNGKTVSYKRFVAQKLIPNPNNCDKVFSKNGNQYDTRPENLMWVWTRENKLYTPQQALEKTNDKYLIEYYSKGDKKALQRGINNVLERIYSKDKNNLLSELYLTINDYAERCLLFDLQSDIIRTFIGLQRQQHRKKVKMTQYKDNFISHNTY
jgi:hypothetical protein